MAAQLKDDLTNACKQCIHEGFESVVNDMNVKFSELNIKIDQVECALALLETKLTQKAATRTKKAAATTEEGAAAADGTPAPAAGIKLTTAKSWFIAQYQASEEFRAKYLCDELRAQLAANTKLNNTKPDLRLKTESSLVYNYVMAQPGKSAEIKKEFDALKEAQKNAAAAAAN